MNSPNISFSLCFWTINNKKDEAPETKTCDTYMVPVNVCMHWCYLDEMSLPLGAELGPRTTKERNWVNQGLKCCPNTDIYAQYWYTPYDPIRSGQYRYCRYDELKWLIKSWYCNFNTKNLQSELRLQTMELTNC